MRALASRLWLRQALGFAALFVALTLILLVVFNLPWFWQQVRYGTGGVHHTSTPRLPSDDRVFTITIPRIGVSAPVVLSDHRDWASLHDDLERGVVHYAGTALPGEAGHIVITGHSSNYIWDPGRYNYVFSLLGRLQAGDEIDLAYRSEIYTYRVTQKLIQADDRTELAPSQTELLSVTTCWPPFTTWQRLIIRAEPTDRSKTKTTPKQLPQA